MKKGAMMQKGNCWPWREKGEHYHGNAVLPLADH
jgi:hypothetical protein